MTLLCYHCDQRFEVFGRNKPLEKDLKKGAIVCPFCSKKEVRLSITGPTDRTVRFTADELWSASNGFGLPDEIAIEPEIVEAMLLAHRVVEVKLRQSVTGRVVIEKLKLNKGITLHLVASGDGAAILKITRERK